MDKQLREWMRANGIVPRGTARDAAESGVRDLLILARCNAADGLSVKRLPTGERLPASLVEGDHLADFGGFATGPGFLDPLTGLYVVTVKQRRQGDGDYDLGGFEYVDVELHPSEAVRIGKKKRQGPPHVQEGMAEWRLARAAWEQQRDSVIYGYLGGDDAREYAIVNPPPDPFQFVAEAAARRRAPESLTVETDAA